MVTDRFMDAVFQSRYACMCFGWSSFDDFIVLLVIRMCNSTARKLTTIEIFFHRPKYVPVNIIMMEPGLDYEEIPLVFVFIVLFMV